LRKIITCCVLAVLIITGAGCSGSQATDTYTNTMSAEELAALIADKQLGTSMSKAAPVGVTLESNIDVVPYFMYLTIEETGELYLVKLSFLELKRGKQSLDYLNRLGMFKGFPYYRSLPPEGFEYVVSRFRFEYYPTGLPGNLTYQLKQGEFKAYSQDNVEYDDPGPYILPWKEDVYDYYIYPHDSFEMEIMSLVAKNDNKPVLYYEKGKMWFRLY
jgi:hypothetical protein